MPTAEGCIKSGCQCVCSFCLLTLGILLIVPGAALLVISFKEDFGGDDVDGIRDLFDTDNTLRLVGLVLSGVAVVCLLLACCLCCRLCNDNEPATVRRGQVRQRQRHTHTPPSQQTASVLTGYTPAPSSSGATAGYVPMVPQQPVPMASPPHQASYPYNPQHMSSQYPAIPYYGPPPMMAPPAESYPPPPVAPGYHAGVSSPPNIASSHLLQSPHSASYPTPDASGVLPTAPPVEETPPSYEEAMNVQKT